jgi:hypothetical protein
MQSNDCTITSIKTSNVTASLNTRYTYNIRDTRQLQYSTGDITWHAQHKIKQYKPDKIKWKKGMAHVKGGAMGNSIKLAGILSPAVIAWRTRNIAMWTISVEKQNNLLPQCCSNPIYNHCCQPGLFPCTSLAFYSLGSINPYLSIQNTVDSERKTSTEITTHQPQVCQRPQIDVYAEATIPSLCSVWQLYLCGTLGFICPKN